MVTRKDFFLAVQRQNNSNDKKLKSGDSNAFSNNHSKLLFPNLAALSPKLFCFVLFFLQFFIFCLPLNFLL